MPVLWRHFRVKMAIQARLNTNKNNEKIKNKASHILENKK